jgi:hypothetical protein
MESFMQIEKERNLEMVGWRKYLQIKSLVNEILHSVTERRELQGENEALNAS